MRIAIILMVLAIHICVSFGKKVSVGKKSKDVYGYDFFQGMDSYAGDIKNLGTTDLAELKAFCDSSIDCVGFNTNGWVKNTLLSEDQWKRFSKNGKDGIYKKIV